MTRYHQKIITLCLCLILLGLYACKKTGSPSSPSGPSPTGTLNIQSISQNSGPDSTLVMISGKGFDANPADDSVFFNGHPAFVQQANDSVLNVLVPVRAGTGDVSVKVNGVTAIGPLFTYQYTTSEMVLAGNGDINGIDGQGKAASFFFPTGIAIEPNGNLLVTQAADGRVRLVTPSGLVSSLNTSFFPSIDLNRGTFGVYQRNLESIAIDYSNNLVWVGNPGDNSVSSFSDAGPILIKTLVDSLDNLTGSDTNKISTFEFPTGVAALNGTLYIVDNETNNLQILNPRGRQIYSVLNTGSDNIRSLLNAPSGVAVDGSGNLYIANAGGNDILKITNDSIATVLAGSGLKGTADGNGTAASFFSPEGIAVDSSGNVYVSDTGNQRIRLISSSGDVITLPYQISYAAGLAVNPAGSIVYVADAAGCVIFEISIR